MHPTREPIDPLDLVHDLSPKQHGPYGVTIEQDSDMDIWHSLVRRCGVPVWSLEVHEAQVELNALSASEFASEFGVVSVRFKFRVNRETEMEATIAVNSACIIGLTPII